VPPHSTNTAEASPSDCRRARVAIVAPRIQALVAGQEVQADLLLRLWRDDPDVEVSYIATNLQLPAWLESIPYLRTLIRFPLYLAALFSGLRRVEITHIFSASFSSFLIATAPAYFVSRILSKKVIINYRSGLAQEHMRASPFARGILRKANCVVVPSNYLVTVFGESQINAHAIANVVDLTRFSYRVRDPLRPILLCSRNLEPCYGIDLVLRAFAEVQKAFSEARLCILGEGSQENAVRQLIAELKLTGVGLPGRVTREKIGDFYNHADILINASRIDNMPVSILEALAAGLPVVTSDAGGIPYIVQHEKNGLVSKTGDWKNLAENVIRLLKDPALTQRLTENAYQQSSTYHWDSVRQQWLNLYRAL
jgi:glycosyltransferase involved in cell wall biosynthesis